MKARILIVEDEPAVADSLVYALATDGCEPLWTRTAGEARGLLSKGAIDLVVLDVGLPDANGFDLCREIRRTSDLPVLFLTARALETDRVVGLEIGGDDYVVKPFSPREVSARVRAILRRTREPAPPAAGVVAPPAFAVDPDRLTIAYFGTTLELTRSEYRLLATLIAHPGRVYSRARLLEGLFDDAGASSERAIDSHVKALRAKLRAVRGDVDPIETHRGDGYSLRERW